MLEELGYGQRLGSIKETGEGVDDILRRHLSAIVKLDPLAQGEGPRASIPGSLPKLGKSGYRLEIGIKLNESVEDLVDNGATIDIGHQGRIKRNWSAAQYTAEYPPELRFRRGAVLIALTVVSLRQP